MRFKMLAIAFVFSNSLAFCQSKNNISVVYGIDANLVDIHNAIRDYGYNNKTGKTYGLSYSRNISSVFSLETGLLYADYKVELTTIGPAGGTYDQNLHLLSVPVYAKWTFLKYFYGQCGVSFDHQTNYSADHAVDDQSGAGISFGIGGKYNFGPMAIFANPYYTNHRFYGRNNLMEGGVKFGLGYNF